MLKRRAGTIFSLRIILPVFFLLCLSGQSAFAVHDYINALYLTTYFYGAQRCGNTASWCHGACHVKDGLAPGGTGIDLTGGWHDCGDHVTFGQTAPYSAGVLLEGYLLKPASYKDTYSPANSAAPSNGIPDLLDEVKIMTDLLIKCTTGGRFYYQKGNGDYDHKHMCEPRDFSLNYTITEGGESDGGRPLSFVTSGGSNVCGDAAAALALMAIAYQPYDAAYATTCFNTAKTLFAIGDTSPGTVGGGSYYGATNYQDDMAWGGAAIYRASVARGAAEATYLTKATSYISGGQGAGSWPLCYDHTEFLAHYNLYKINGLASDLTWMTNDVTYYKTKMVTCGTGSYAWVTGWGSLRIWRSPRPYCTASAESRPTILL
jgi:endoglucanase